MNTFQLPNGIQVVHTPYPSGRVTHICLGLGIGSINDPVRKEGLAHFWEHSCFKGTGKRTTNKVFSDIESHGGEINAYTQKGMITFEVSIPNTYVEKAFDVLNDIVFNSTFSDDDLEKERKIIHQEIIEQNESEDNDFEIFHSHFFKEHPLGNPILGTQESVNSIHKSDISNFLKNNLDTKKVVLSVVSSLSSDKIESLVTKYFSNVPVMSCSKRISRFDKYVPFNQRESSECANAFVMIGFPVSSRRWIDYWSCSLILDYLAGDFNGSLINRSLREKHGLIYHCGLDYYSYGLNGIATLSFSIDPENIDTALELIDNEVYQLSKGIINRKLALCKNRIKGQLLLSNDNKQAVSVQVAEDWLDTGTLLSMEEKVWRLDFTAKYEINRALGYFKPERISKLVYA